MKHSISLLLVLSFFALSLTACDLLDFGGSTDSGDVSPGDVDDSEGDEPTDGDTSDGDILDSDQPDGDTTDGDVQDGDESDDDMSEDDQTDEDLPEDDQATYCGDGTVNGTEECEPTDTSNCDTNETCNSTTCMCQDDGNKTGTCIALDDDLQCRQSCTALSHSCGENFICFGVLGTDYNNQLILSGGICNYVTSNQTDYDSWWNSLEDCGEDGSCATGKVCVSSGADARCATSCDITADTCPSGYYPGYESLNEVPWACMRYPDDNGNFSDLCTPWGDVPTCSTEGDSCDPIP